MTSRLGPIIQVVVFFYYSVNMYSMAEFFPRQSTSEVIEVGRELSDELDKIRRSRINPETFRGVKFFTDQEIDSDLAHVDAKERGFKERAQFHTPEQRVINDNAEVIEVMMPMIIRDFDWLGANTNIIYTSRYDDIVNGIDSVAQLMEPNESWNIGMEIDFTSSEEEMKDKIKKIETRLQDGKISSVKYFDSPTTGKLKNLKMPKIAFGISGKEMGDFVSIIADAYLSRNKESAQKELRNHRMKSRFIELTTNQLREFSKITTEAGNTTNARLHQGLLERFRQRKLI